MTIYPVHTVIKVTVAHAPEVCSSTAMSVRNLVESLDRELAAAGTDLVGDSDLLQGILAGCGDCIKVLDLEGRLQFMSEGGKRVMEVDDFSALKGCPWPDFWTGTGNVDATAAVEQAKAGKTARFRGAANTARGNLRYWDVQVSPIFGSDGRPAQLLSISRDVTEEWQAAERERFLMKELAHRSKNSFAMVLAIARQTFRGEAHATPLEEYTSRVTALAAAHSAAMASNWTSTRIGDVIDAALASHRASGRFRVAGPDLNVTPRQALALALAVNELATNALKYGALSSPHGTVEISWTTTDRGIPGFVFQWQERGGPPVVKPSREGFGSRVIKDFMANDFGGAVTIFYDSEGIRCELKAPLDGLSS